MRFDKLDFYDIAFTFVVTNSDGCRKWRISALMESSISYPAGYRIGVAYGVYKISSKVQFLGFPVSPAMICPKYHVDVVGNSRHNTILWAKLPITDDNVHNYRTVFNFADDGKIENIIFVSKNILYTL